MGAPLRVLMTLDSVGGVWRYAVDLAAGLREAGAEVILAGLGPEPSPDQRREAEAVAELDWSAAPLDWMADGPAAVAEAPAAIDRLARRHRADLVHLNVPSQAAGLATDLPVLAVSHSCTATWFAAVRGSALPAGWEWQGRLNRAGFDRADAIVAPSAAHAAALRRVYGPLPGLTVVHNACRAPVRGRGEGHGIVATGRWWDEGKGGAVLDAAAEGAAWPVTMIGALQGDTGDGLRVRHARAPGTVPHAGVLKALHGAGALVAPSLYEPFGLAAVEAARCGLPLILSDIATFRELWDGAALFFPPGDVPALRAAMDRIAADEALRRRLGRAAQDQAARYTPPAQIAAMLRLYGRLAGARQTATIEIAG